jgi:predicted dehydrogenase
MALRMVQVGVGPTGIGVTWLRAIQESADWTLAGVVDARAEHLSIAAERAGLRAEQCFATIDQAVRALEVDALAIVVSSPLHAELCAQALRAGKHVVVEKPFTLDFTEARALAEQAEQAGLRLMVDQNYRYLSDIRTLRHAVGEGLIGEVEFVEVGFDCLWPPRPYQESMANTMLLEMAVHHFDSLRFVLGVEARTAVGQTWRPRWTRYAGDTWVSCQYEFEGGIRVAYHGSLESPGLRSPWQGLWRIEGRRGALHLADLGAGYGVYLSRDPRNTAQGYPEADVLRAAPLPLVDSPEFHDARAERTAHAQLRTDPGAAIGGTLAEFAAALRERRRPQSDARDNLRTLAMAFAVSLSSAEGRVVDLRRAFFAPTSGGE